MNYWFQRVIDFLKVDVEGAEFAVLREMVDSGIHRQVKQLAVELHTPRMRKRQEAMSAIDYGEIYDLLYDLEGVGFVQYLHNATYDCCGKFTRLTGDTKCCVQLYFVNSKYMPVQDFQLRI